MYWKYGIAIEQRGLIGPEALNYIPVVKMQLGWIDKTDVGKLLFRPPELLVETAERRAAIP